MRETKGIYIINILIEKHIKTIMEGKKSKQDLEIDYILLHEAIETIVDEYNKKGDSRRKKSLQKILTTTYKQIQDYLIYKNRYDHRMLETYVVLDKAVGNLIIS